MPLFWMVRLIFWNSLLLTTNFNAFNFNEFSSKYLYHNYISIQYSYIRTCALWWGLPYTNPKSILSIYFNLSLFMFFNNYFKFWFMIFWGGLISLMKPWIEVFRLTKKLNRIIIVSWLRFLKVNAAWFVAAVLPAITLPLWYVMVVGISYQLGVSPHCTTALTHTLSYPKKK